MRNGYGKYGTSKREKIDGVCRKEGRGRGTEAAAT